MFCKSCLCACLARGMPFTEPFDLYYDGNSMRLILSVLQVAQVKTSSLRNLINIVQGTQKMFVRGWEKFLPALD